MLAKSLLLFSSVSFFIYGPSCLFSRHMREEFTRFGLSSAQRVATGSLQILGAAGLLAGLLNEPLGITAALGLGLLMFLGVLARIRIRDRLPQLLPALFYSILNAALSLLLLSSR